MPLSRLKPDSAVMVSALTALGVVAIWTHNVPNMTDVREAAAFDSTVDNSRRTALIEAGVLVIGVSVISRDFSPWIVGGGILVLLDLMTKHANAINPNTGKYGMETGNATVTALPMYEEAM